MKVYIFAENVCVNLGTSNWEFHKDICEFIWITNFQIYMNREIIFREINFILFQCLNSVVSKFRYIFVNGLFDFDFTEGIFANLPWIR